MVRPDDGGGSNGGGSDSTAGESSASDQSAGEQPDGQNLAAYFTRHADDDVALITPSGEITYGQLGARIKDWRCRLTAAGVKRGDRVVIMTGNNVDFVTVHVASIGLGAASVPLNHVTSSRNAGSTPRPKSTPRSTPESWP
jgi:acyl-CoA synthetase (AMP-forming)/AMP-acid ligase II